MAKRSHSGGPSGSHRTLRIGEAIRRRLSEMLARGEIHDPDLTMMSITVGEVRVGSDLRVATAYILPLGGKDAEAALEALRRNKGEIRHQVGKALGIKHTPEMRFALDDTFDRMDETRRIFSDERVQRDIQKQDTPDDTPDGDEEE
ncbi:MAG: 30S ribosome-binding factor RbfA [Alphaproteobacteria bacterium]|jgi:ribosome-binding factor A|uniref:Ribosome-binding factor A n=1 Tax=Celeribacter baekdonensis TaxID=875171 RepID=A0A1G7KTJ8_9RHOB|nr:30S ribosome-binding factor RbfA [Celeribacter baekdonensis]MBU0643500.1 30S ribosome-binding factor RbfA [Alphaproteobacteria bacterium]MBU1277895.1 30S ribosome-binding factor RbfA [Alphaproteobacteria bacterium]MBU1572626.1 30S ribosome-binding factor RbfA [Alphaproteobacteria bacterium]MBU1826900.1 30S ribosome-binding factor RbfA [Alphaproteobacteria bacterium]MBU2077155.1 30S ribosome-binding factor RbfA [Alphaproteobacteria bacterium]